MLRFRHIAASAVLVVIFCGVAGATPQKDEIELVTTTLPTLNPGQTAWVSTLWHGTANDATEFTMTAEGPRDITIGYPENTGDHSSLYKSSTLLANDTDYASLKVTVGDNALGPQTIELHVEYRAGNNGNGNGNGAKVKLDEELPLPVVAFDGPAVEQVTTSLGPIPAGHAAWVDISYKANKPGVTGASLTVTPPAGATVTYPNEGSSAGFAADPDLSVGETDHASVKLDTGTLTPGSHTVELDLAYGQRDHLQGTATLVVG